MKIEEIMTSPAITICKTATIRDAIAIMREKRIGFLPVVVDKLLVGVITDRDILIRVDFSDLEQPIMGIATPTPHFLNKDEDALTAAKLMAEYKVRRVPITVDGHVVGVLTSKTLAMYPQYLKYVLATYYDNEATPEYLIYTNHNPHDSIKVDDFPL